MADSSTTTTTPAAASRWWRTKSRFDAIRAAGNEYDNTVFMPAFEAVERETKAIPHVTTSKSFVTQAGDRLHLSTANPADVATAVRACNVTRDENTQLIEYYETCAELVRAIKDRDEQRQAIHARHDWDAINDRVEKWAELQSKLQDRLIKWPAPNPAALRWKLDYLFTPNGREGDQSTDSWSADFVAQTIADWSRFLPPAAHTPDGIEQAWQTLTLAHGAYGILNETPDDDSEAEERIFLEAVETCETRITEATATTPQGVLRQLQCAALHTITNADAEKALLEGDFDTAEKLEASSNPHLALTFAAIRSLIAQGCVA